MKRCIAWLLCIPTMALGQTLRIFVLAGQSNMEGQAHVEHLIDLATNPSTRDDYSHLVDSNGNFIERTDVRILFNDQVGNLAPGFGLDSTLFGPELQFGHIVGDFFNDPVLLLKYAWGGTSLAVDWRPPSSGIPSEEEGFTCGRGPCPDFAYNSRYRGMVAWFQSAISNLDSIVPDFTYTSTELAGFVWFQGFNDVVDPRKLAEYEVNLVNLIRDVRTDFGEPDLPFIIGELGQEGPYTTIPTHLELREIQQRVAELPEFETFATFVETARFVVSDEPVFDGSFHYWGRADTMVKIGQQFGRAALQELFPTPTTAFPTWSPTELPSFSPSSNQPSVSPSTINPSNAPSTSPSSFPTPTDGFCADDTSTNFYVPALDECHDCLWLAGNVGFQTSLCDPTDEFGVFDVCEETCGKCRKALCDDDKFARFLVDGQLQRCTFFETRQNLLPTYCAVDHPSHVAFLCEESCGTCSDNCEDKAGVFLDLQGVGRNCGWLRIRPQIHDLFCSPSHPASSICIETCGVCDSISPGLNQPLPTARPTPPNAVCLRAPSAGPSVSLTPSTVPSGTPSESVKPSTSSSPSNPPSISLKPSVSDTPTMHPTDSPAPSMKPSISFSPTPNPTDAPSITGRPSGSISPSTEPSFANIPSLSLSPTSAPVVSPTFPPTTTSPTRDPTRSPMPSPAPSNVASDNPSLLPTASHQPTQTPFPTLLLTLSALPSMLPSALPTQAPTTQAPTTSFPSLDPTGNPTAMPSASEPSPAPTLQPTTARPTPSPTPSSPVPCPEIPEGGCSICGPGECITFPDNVVRIEGQPSVTCGVFEVSGELGLIPPEACALISGLVDSLCFCRANRPPWIEDERIPQPSAAPSEAPSVAPIVFGGGAGGGLTICFSGEMTVVVKDRGVTAMRDLDIGDKLLVDKDRYETVYAFGHYQPNITAQYLRISTQSEEETPLEISNAHMVFVEGEGAIPASLLKMGDVLEGGAIVSSIQSVASKGVFAPFTPSGRLVVNGVTVSSYVAFQESATVQVGGWNSPISYQWMAHIFTLPLRVRCYYLSKCQGTYNSDGVLALVSAPLAWYQWFLTKSAFLQSLIATMLLAPSALLFVAIELLLSTVTVYRIYGALGLIGVLLIRYHRRLGNGAKSKTH